MRESTVIAVAIVTGSVIIATGLYLGLQPGSSGPGPVGPGPVGPAPVVLGERTLPAPPVERGGAPVPAHDDAASVAARAALEARKPSLTERCWKPALLRAPTPATSRFRYMVSFDPQGKQIAQGISEVREASRADVAECLRAQPMDLRIPPPGTNVSTEVWLEFP
jgi:hypothetical protein